MTDAELRVRALEIIRRLSTEQMADWMVADWKEQSDKNHYLSEVADRIRDTHPGLSDEIEDYLCSWGGAA